MYQVVGKIVNNNSKVVGFVLYDFNIARLFNSTFDYCAAQLRNNKVSNAEIVNNQIVVTDGSFEKLPIYNVNGFPSANNLPVIVERVTNNDVTVGYTLITEKGVHKRLRVSDIVNSYREFYNAKVVTKDGKSFISAKKGTFREVKLDKYKDGEPLYRSTKTTVNTEPFIIEKGVFKRLTYYGKQLKNVVIPDSITEVGNYAFEGATSLVEVTIPNSVTTIGNSAFKGATSLVEVTIPNSVTKIGLYAFTDCTGLKKVHIPTSVTELDAYAFSRCRGLETIYVEGGINEIKAHTFEGCVNLKEVTICEGVKQISDCAFDSCFRLEYVYIPSTVKGISDYAFSRCNKDFKVECCSGSYAEQYCKDKGIKYVTVSANDNRNTET